MNIETLRDAIHEGMIIDLNGMRQVRAGEMTRVAIAEAALSTMLSRMADVPHLLVGSDAEMFAFALDAIAGAEQIVGRSLGTYLPRYLAIANQIVAIARAN